ncbi:MAG: endo alpha-1,4 polygalactosaminidase [Actinomycetota bacterium]|nr:endo alpha-1,4 polygalactosaminidase [Actinomycetota bacterium]
MRGLLVGVLLATVLAVTVACSPPPPTPVSVDPAEETTTPQPIAAPEHTSRLAPVRNWALAIGGDLNERSLERLGRFDLVVVDGEKVTPEQVALLHRKGTLVLGYLSVGTIEKDRSWFPAVERHRLGKLEDWDEWYADVSKPGFRNELTGVAETMLAKDLDGLFLDNVDIIETHPEQDAGMRLLVERIANRTHAVGGYVLAQNGEDVLGGMVDMLDGWNREDVTWTYDFDSESYVRVSERDHQSAIRALRDMRVRGLLTLATDYVAQPRSTAEEESVAAARSAGALPYVSDIWLERVPTRPFPAP